MSLTIKPTIELPAQVIADLINRAFAGYIGGSVHFTPHILAGFLVQHDVNLALSGIAIRDEQPVGLALVARRGATSRVAMMGIATEARGQGVGKWLIQQIIGAAKERGDLTLTLEVIEQNLPAVRLYESAGFSILRRLTGYRGEALTGEPASLEAISLAEAARKVTAWSQPDLPWPCSGESLINYAPPHIAYRMNECYALISTPDAERVMIRGLAVPVEKQRSGLATRLVAALLAAHPGKDWFVQAICPEEFGALFTRNGFVVDTISQFQMLLTL